MGCDYRELFGAPSAPSPDEKLARAREAEQRAAEAAMAHELANLLCPEEVKAFGRRHGIPNFAEVVWNAGFFAGYRQRVRDDKEGVDRG